ncbi:MAG: hypothetical protein A3C30_03945 [Candidatus Levybacteria bacterium RIFCSPHIGHO2_02_FULL_40_18]|nr:MAG: hypothetical protein A2869_00565 [Candidatus Levybacteria bacterium RIFCSPHIGHO2_01_FULL_40_58]OGH26236.1 MAG: hypothetical protein A3C30_03945 [Candidatus Levybacteria bacterium RIFCSPHIGHO2_02_FULL_40_18]OGH31488.1 MAG: hypothetical protein A3E43_02985 [Candidatus Levybacteria bacterium RIFCSPHIGHO2_12_FULL_40_31]OGH40128.1 MAG: hypothetical protein A2894_04305 [Candidatus Levybacteria bacterium RIFCSPLOWO2_01_FULL_40_64]OGH49081.1 MAG: hypothetical protein A3I54_00730 [Candidatus Lev
MEIFNFFLKIFSNQDALFRIILIILISIYGLFALILFLQIRNLNRIINQITFSPIFIVFTLVHLLATVALLFFAVLFL